MNVISSMKMFTHPGMPGVSIYAWDEIKTGTRQEVVVDVAPGAMIPPHRHSVDAQMIIVSGSAEVLFDENELFDQGMTLNRKNVGPGDLVYFRANLTHGFRASNEGLKFVSINGGIVDNDPDKWDMTGIETGKHSCHAD